MFYLKDISKKGFAKVVPRRHDLGHVFRHIDQASSGNSGLHYDVPGKSEKLLFV